MTMKEIYAYHEVLKYISSQPFPPFEAPEMLEKVWKRRWGVRNHIDPLRMVLVRRPGDELKSATEEFYDEKIGAIVDKAGGRFYFRSNKAPDIPLMQKQHDALVEALRKEGVEVVYLKDPDLPFTKIQFTRDPVVSVNGGVIIGRMAGVMRRGEELSVLKTVASLGIPILRTVHGNGTFEGGSFIFINDKTAAVGLSQRVSEEGARQVEEVLKIQGVELIRVHLAGFTNHLDECMMMIDGNRALIHTASLPYGFIRRLLDMNIRLIDVHPEEPHAVNGLAVRPGRVILSDDTDRTAEILRKEGVEVVQVNISEIRKNGGGVHCSTCELLRGDSTSRR